MGTLYFRNGERIMSHLVEEGISHLTFTSHNLGRQGHDGLTSIRQFYLHSGIRPKVLIIGPQGANEYWSDGNVFQPVNKYPVWSDKHQTFQDLEVICDDLRENYDRDGHMQVIISNCKAVANSPWWQNIFRFQQHNPDIKMFLSHGNSVRLGFGGRFVAADVDASQTAFVKSVYMPAGNKFDVDEPGFVFKMRAWESWINMLGFSVADLLEDKIKRLRFNIRSSVWASKHYADNFKFNYMDTFTQDATDLPESEYIPRSSHAIIARRSRVTTKDAEKILCNRCSIATSCKLFRSDQVCGLGDSEMAKLSENFGTRDAGRILDGLAQITRIMADRFEDAVENEEATGEVDPEVTRQGKTVFDMGQKLAKLVNPELAGPGVRVNVLNVGTNGSVEAVESANPKKLMATIIQQFEVAGFARGDITPDMLKGALEAVGRGTTLQMAITSTSVKEKDDKAADEFKRAVTESRVVNGSIVAEEKIPVLPIPRNL